MYYRVEWGRVEGGHWASEDLSGSQPISPFLCISLDRTAAENNGIQGAISKSENWHRLGRVRGRLCLCPTDR